MKKFTKRLLTSIAALGLLAPMMGVFTNAKAAHYSYTLRNKLVMRAINHGHVYGPTKRFFIRYKGFTFRCVPRYSHRRLRPGGVIRALNNNYHVSNRQVIAALQGHHINVRRHARRNKSATRRPRRTRRYYLRFHGKIVGWAFNYRTYRKDQAYINTLGTPRRKRRAHRAVRRHRTRYYHIYADGYDDGWTNSYRVYKQCLGQLKKSIAASRAQSNDAQVTPATGSSQDQTSSDDQDQGTESQEQDVVTNPDEPSADSQSSDNQQAANDQPAKNTGQNQQSNDVNMNLAEMKAQTIADINQDRENNGLAPLTESAQLDKLASIRAAQCQTDLGHFDAATGYYHNAEDAYKLGYVNSPSDDCYGENLDNDNTGSVEMSDGTMAYNHNGSDMANFAEDEMMNHDADQGNGHRINILRNGIQYLGVGVNYDSQNTSDPYPYKLAEEFAY